MPDFSGDIPSREPNFHFERHGRYVSAWHAATPDGDNLIVTTMPSIAGPANTHPLQVAAATYAEMHYAPGPHRSLPRLLGVRYETIRTPGNVSYRIVVPTDTNVNLRKRTIGVAIPGVTNYPGSHFADVELARELDDNGNFLASNDSRLHGHDMLFHYFSATAYLAPTAMDRLRQRAAESRQPEQAKLLVGDLEAEGNATTLGRALLLASSAEVRRATDQTIEHAWRYAGTFVARIIGADITEATQLGMDLREHILTLDRAIVDAELSAQSS